MRLSGIVTDRGQIGYISGTAMGEGLGGFSLPKLFWTVKKYFILFYLTRSITYRNKLPYILVIIKIIIMQFQAFDWLDDHGV